MKLGLIISFIIYSQSVELKCLNCSDQNIFSVLIITETDVWVHDSIESGLELIEKIGIQNNFNVYYSDDSRVITYENLEKIRTIIFLNTTEEILTNDEQKLMESFIRSGKGFVGVHAAADTENKWQRYGKLVGAYL